MEKHSLKPYIKLEKSISINLIEADKNTVNLKPSFFENHTRELKKVTKTLK